jgi:hypothetical protein
MAAGDLDDKLGCNRVACDSLAAQSLRRAQHKPGWHGRHKAARGLNEHRDGAHLSGTL